MSAINLQISENPGAGLALLQETDIRERAAERLADEMDHAARAYERMTERLGLVLESGRTRRRTAWNFGPRQRTQPPVG